MYAIIILTIMFTFTSFSKEPLQCLRDKEGILTFEVPVEYVRNKMLKASYITENDFADIWHLSLDQSRTSDNVIIHYGKGWKKGNKFVGKQITPDVGMPKVLKENDEICFAMCFVHDTFPFGVGDKTVMWLVRIPKVGVQSQGRLIDEKEYRIWINRDPNSKSK
jgi:hypothetical protein